MRDTRSLSRRTRPPVSNARVFGRQAASQAGASSGHVARVRQQVPSGLAAHMRLFSLCRPPHRRVFLDKGQTSAERKKLQHTSQHAIAARVHACARAYVRAYVRSHPNDEETALPTDNPRAKLDRRRFLKVTPKNVAAASSGLRTLRESASGPAHLPLQRGGKLQKPLEAPRQASVQTVEKGEKTVREPPEHDDTIVPLTGTNFGAGRSRACAVAFKGPSPSRRKDEEENASHPKPNTRN